jgi:predicted flavoprotein YhiN
VHRRLARELGHTLVDPVPSLFTLDVKGDAFTVDMAGVVAKDVQVSLLDPPIEVLKAMGLRSKKQLPWTRGPLLFTHTGLSGPAILKLSSFAARGFHHLK